MTLPETLPLGPRLAAVGGAAHMLLVIFGAGASYDSAAANRPDDAVTVRPPLADQLFDVRFKDVFQRFRVSGPDNQSPLPTD